MITASNKRWLLTGICVCACFVTIAAPVHAEIVTWTAAGADDHWATGGNWSNNSGPTATDTVLFDNTGSTFLPGEVTSFLNDNRTVGGLAYQMTSGFHTTDLGGSTLSVFGSLNFNTNLPNQSTATLRDGVLVVADPAGAVNVGRSYGGGAVANVNLSGLSQFAATVNQFHVGTSLGGYATGIVSMAAHNVVVADQIAVGGMGSGAAGNGSGTVHLGQTNELATAGLFLAKETGSATVDMANGGSLEVGSADARTLLSIADQNYNGNNTFFSGRLDLTGGTLTAHLDGLIVGRKSGGAGSSTGEMFGGTGDISVGSTGNVADVIIGQGFNGGVIRGTADLSGMQSFTANLNQMIVGQSVNSSASGSLKLAELNSIDAKTIVVGDNASGELRLGISNTIATRELTIAKDNSSATVEIAAGGHLTLGSSEQRTAISIAEQNTNTNSSFSGRLDLTGGSLDAHLADVVVGRKFGGSGNAVGELISGGGQLDIGEAGNTANMIIGQSVNGGSTRGTVDLSSAETLTANLNQLIMGQSISGVALGYLYLPSHNTIDAKKIIVGDYGDGTIRLGETNTITADSLVIANGASNSRVEAPLGSKVELGTADKPMDLSVGVFDANTNSSMSGKLDLSGAQTVAHLGQVVIGSRVGGGGGVGTGTLNLSNDAGNRVEADTVTLGTGVGQGTLNFGGGTLTANSIQRGSGVANFNWQGGTLNVNTFGSPANEFDLNNQGTGVLAPGASPGQTQIYGDYRQGAAAAYQAELGGTVPATQYDRVLVSSLAQLGGTLDVRLYNGFAPQSDDSFTVLSAGSITGKFGNAAAGAAGLITPFGSFDVAYTNTEVVLSNFVPDPLAAAASIGALSDYAGKVLGGSTVAGGLDATFLENERGILYGQFDTIDSVALDDLIESQLLDFTTPNFALPADQLQVWDLSFEGDAIGGAGISLVFSYSDAGLSPAEEAALVIYHFENDAWIPLSGTLDTLANTITVDTPSLSPFAVGLVPEPSSFVLVGIALAGVVFGAARRRRTTAER